MKPKTEEKDHPQDGKIFCKGEYHNNLMLQLARLNTYTDTHIYIYKHTAKNGPMTLTDISPKKA